VAEFIDLPLDPRVPGWPCYSAPAFSTKITQTAAGDEKRNRNWRHPLRTFKLPGVVRDHEVLEAVQDHWLIAGGPEMTFPFRDPMDFASIGLECPNEVPDWTGLDQALGTGDGFVADFQLEKTYTRGAYSYTRPIFLPVDGDLTILVNGADPASLGYTFDVSRPGGVVTFTPALQNGHVATWGGLFDVIVRYMGDDAFAAIVQSMGVSGVADLDLKECRSC
jgi:uncharacterized protein (TIGR02217 family)